MHTVLFRAGRDERWQCFFFFGLFIPHFFLLFGSVRCALELASTAGAGGRGFWAVCWGEEGGGGAGGVGFGGWTDTTRTIPYTLFGLSLRCPLTILGGGGNEMIYKSIVPRFTPRNLVSPPVCTLFGVEFTTRVVLQAICRVWVSESLSPGCVAGDISSPGFRPPLTVYPTHSPSLDLAFWEPIHPCCY